MRFTDHSLIRRLCWLPLALLLSACASGPSEQPAAHAEETVFNAVLPSVVPQRLNPYTQPTHGRIGDNERALFDQAQQAMQRGAWPSARTTLESLTHSAPQLSGPWLNLGIVWQKLGQADKARTALEQAIAANPNNLDAYNHLAVLLRETGDFAQAREIYQQALAVWPWHLTTHRNLGILYDLYLGDGAQALLHYEAAQALMEEPSAELTGWIIDLKRRLDAEEKQP